MFSLLLRIRTTLIARVQHLVQVWDEFWFRPVDPFALGVLRILSGWMLVYTHFVWGLKLDAFFGPNGWQDELLVQVQQAESTAYSFWWLVPPEWLQTVHWICMGVLVLYMLGACTRLTSIAAFVIVISYANRAMNANFGLDQINVLLTFYLMLGPSGHCLSLDSIYRRWRNSGQSAAPKEQVKFYSARLATRLIQVHMCLVYLFAGISKLKGEAWWNGNAIWMAAVNTEYQTGDLTWLAWYPWLGNLITHVTILWEISFCVLVWNRGWRPIMLIAGTLMHLGIGAFLGMWTFGTVMIFTYVSFISPETWRFLFSGIKATITGSAVHSAASIPPTRTSEIPATTVTPGTSGDKLLKSENSVSMAAWWNGVCRQEPRPLPFLELEENRGACCSLLILDSRLARLTTLQNYLASKGMAGLVATDVQQACGILMTRAISGVLMLADTEADLREALQLRQLLQTMGRQGPVTVVALRSRIAELMHESAEPDHRFVVEPFTPRDLLEEWKAGWASREVAFSEADCRPSSSEESSSDSLAVEHDREKV